MRSRSQTGKLVHVAIAIATFTLGMARLAFLCLFVCECLYLFKRNKQLLVVSFILCGAIFACAMIRKKIIPEPSLPISGTVVFKEESRLILRSGGFRYYVYVDGMEAIVPGDIVEVEGIFQDRVQKQMPHAFDYERYLETIGIANVIYGTKITVTGQRFSLGIINHMVQSYVKANFRDQAAAHIRMLVLGETSAMESEFRQEAKELGIMHLFAISGMHLGIILGFLDKLFKRLYLSKGAHSVILSVFLVLYNLVTGFKVSLFRASFIVGCCFFGDRVNPRLSRLDILSILFVSMLLVNPASIDSLGFRLSFGMAFCLMLGHDLIKHPHKLMALAKTTLFLNLCLLPVILEANGGIGVLFVVMNLVYITFMKFILLPLTFATLFFPFLSGGYLRTISLFQDSISFFSCFNVFLTFNLTSSWAKALYFLGFFLLMCFPKRKTVSIGACLVLALSFAISLVRVPGVQKAVIFDIGQGDAVLIGDHETVILIDTGAKDEYDTLVNYLRKENIRVIDLLVITHWHNDHYGELADLLENFRVEALIAPSVPASYLDYGIMTPQVGETITCGVFSFLVVSAFTNSSNENNNSLVLHTKIGTDNWLFMGDAEAKIETNLLAENLPVDIVKVAHHGSATSSSQEFIRWSSPEYAIISVGRNAYELPDPKVVSAWESLAEVLITAEEGTLSFYYLPATGQRHIHAYKHHKYRFWD